MYLPVVWVAISKSFGEWITCNLQLRYLQSKTH